MHSLSCSIGTVIGTVIRNKLTHTHWEWIPIPSDDSRLHIERLFVRVSLSNCLEREELFYKSRTMQTDQRTRWKKSHDHTMFIDFTTLHKLTDNSHDSDPGVYILLTDDPRTPTSTITDPMEDRPRSPSKQAVHSRERTASSCPPPHVSFVLHAHGPRAE